jgi:hypothetical protein
VEYCSRQENHPYQLFLHLNEIEHTRIKVRHPQTNGAVERLNQTIQEEFYKVAFRKRLYRSIEEIQADLDEFMAWYNIDRTNQGRYCQGRTPWKLSRTVLLCMITMSMILSKERRLRSIGLRP